MCMVPQSAIKCHGFRQGHGLELLWLRDIQLSQAYIDTKKTTTQSCSYWQYNSHHPGNKQQNTSQCLLQKKKNHHTEKRTVSTNPNWQKSRPVLVLNMGRLVGSLKGLLFSLGSWKGSACPSAWPEPRPWLWAWVGVEGLQKSKGDRLWRLEPSENTAHTKARWVKSKEN